MNPNTNELISLQPDEALPNGFIEVPDELKEEARLQLDGIVKKVITDTKSPLAKWAAQVRKNQKSGKIKMEIGKIVYGSNGSNSKQKKRKNKQNKRKKNR